ncbi:MAG: hypothetical protein KC912_24245, partial [Proteobacteria bacterium]|nr:hypothetical protein [Pseudomonadota bacterium]
MLTSLLAVLSVPALAAPAPLCADVCVSPTSFEFRTDKTAEAVDGAERTFRVVVYSNVLDDGRGSWESATERAIEDTWAAWTPVSGFDPESDVLIVLGIDDREVRVKTGSQWDADYGLWGRDILPLIDANFLPRAKAGDLDGGMAKLVTAVDEEIGRRVGFREAYIWRHAHIEEAPPVPGLHTVPQTLKRSLPESEAKAQELGYVVSVHAETLPGGRAGGTSSTDAMLADSISVWKNRADLGGRSVVMVSLDEGEILVSPAPEWAQDIAVKRIQVGKDVDDATLDEAIIGAMATMEAMYEMKAEQREAIRKARAERVAAKKAAEEKRIAEIAARRDTAMAWLTGTGIGVAGLMPVGGAGWWMSLVVAARRRFEQAAEARETALTQARANLDDLRLDVDMRERIVELKLKGPVTLQTLEDVGDAVATLHAGLDALDRQLADAKSQKPGSTSLSTGAYDRLTAALDAELEIDTGEAQRKLFDGPTRVIRVEPSAFMAELDIDFADARAGWQRILDAVEASLHLAEQDLPITDLTMMRSQLAEAGMPESWLQTHPLVPSAELAWKKLDKKRVADPVHYLDELDAAIAEDDALEQVIAELIGWQQSVEEAWKEVHAHSVDDLDTAFQDPTLAPGHRAAELEHFTAQFRAAVQSGNALDDARDCADIILTDGARLVAHLGDIRAAVADAERQVHAAAAAVDDTRSRRMTQAKELGKMLQSFVPQALSEAQQELKELDEDIGDAGAALQRAQSHLGASEHLEAVLAAAATVEEVEQGQKDLNELIAHLNEAVETKAKAEALWAGMAASRSSHQSRLAAYGSHASGLDLNLGDAKLAALRSDWDGGPADWSARVDALTAVTHSWSQAVAAAAKRKAAHDAQ